MIGKTISHYSIIEKIGEGGMGEVFLAEDLKLKRQVALKFLPNRFTDQTDKDRFLQEAQAVAALNHTNVSVIHEIADELDPPFIVMEYIEGKTLREVIYISSEKGKKELSTERVIKYAIQIAEALRAAHDKHIVHRDIKSENVMVTNTDQIKVMDFGLAKLRGNVKLTKTSSTLGTLAYMAPEQIEGKKIDARSDIFSFGVVLYEMLTNHMPFRGDYEAAVIYSIVNDDFQPVQEYRTDVPSELLHIVNRSLEKDPDDRYQSMDDMLIDLRRLKRDTSKITETFPAKRVGSEKPVEKLSQNKKNLLIGVGVLVVLSIIICCIVNILDALLSSHPR